MGKKRNRGTRGQLDLNYQGIFRDFVKGKELGGMWFGRLENDTRAA